MDRKFMECHFDVEKEMRLFEVRKDSYTKKNTDLFLLHKMLYIEYMQTLDLRYINSALKVQDLIVKKVFPLNHIDSCPEFLMVFTKIELIIEDLVRKK